MDEGLINRIKQSIQSAPPADPNAAPATPAPTADAAPQTASPSDDPNAGYTALGGDDVAGTITSGSDNSVTLGDLGKAVVGGARDAIVNTADTVNKAAFGVAKFGQEHGLAIPGAPELPSEAGKSPVEQMLPEVDRADETKTGGAMLNVGRDLERFVLGFVGGSRILGGLGVTANGFKGAAAAGALGDFLVSGANDPRLVDFFDAVPALQGPVLEAMHSGEDGNLWAQKLGAAAEGILGGAAIEGLLRTVGVLRRSLQAAQVGGEEAGQKVLQEAGPELQQALKEVQGGTPETGALPAMRDTPSPHTAGPNGQLEMFPAIADRADRMHDELLRIKGDRWIDPLDGKEKILPISTRAREELLAKANDPTNPLKLDTLTPETRDELVRALNSDNDANKTFTVKTERAQPFELNEAQKGQFLEAVQKSLTTPYAVLKNVAPGAAIEDKLSSFMNYRKMDSADSVKGTLDDMATLIKPLVDKHMTEVQTLQSVKERANYYAMRPEVFLANISQVARHAEDIPAYIEAGKILEQSLARDLWEIAKADAMGMATDASKIEYLRRVDILADTMAMTKAVQRGGARATGAGRIRTADTLTGPEIAQIFKEYGMDGFKVTMQKMAVTDGSAAAVIKLLAPSLGDKIAGVHSEWWINAVLSGLGTHIVNAVSGVRNTMLFPMYRAVGGLLTGDMKSFQVGMAQYSGMRSVFFDSLEMAKRSLLTENAYVDAAFHQVERERTWIKADTFGLENGDWLGQGVNAIGTAVRMPSRFLTSGDEFLKQFNYRGSVVARAKAEAYEKGLSDTKMTSYNVGGIQKDISEVDAHVMDALNTAFHPQLEHGTNAAALDDARRATFTRALKEDTWLGGRTLGEVAQAAASSNPWVRSYLLPFVRVPTNIYREMVYESPLALTRRQFYSDIAAGGEKRADAVGRAAMGTIFWGAAGMLAYEGLITGAGPTDPVLNKQWQAAGNQPYSVRIPGGGKLLGDLGIGTRSGDDLFISFNRLGQEAYVLGLAADFAYISAHVDERTADHVATTLTLSLANNLNSRSYFRSLTDLTSVLKSARDPNGAGAIDAYFRSRASSYIPRIVSDLNPDNGLKDARTVLDAVMAKIPGLSNGIEPRRDNFGPPIVPAIGWPFSAVNPFAINISKDGPARNELAYWADSPVRARFQMPPPSIDGRMDLRDAKNTQTGQSAYDRWMEILTEPRFGGKTMEDQMDALVSSEGYKNLKKNGKEDPIYPKHPAAELLRDQMSEHYKAAQQMMLSEPGFEDLRMALAQYKVNKEAIPLGAAPPANPTLQELLKVK